jgi:D-lactate dehydrogenase
MKIVFFEVENWEEEYIITKTGIDGIDFVKDNLDYGNVKKFRDVDLISIFIYSEINKKILDKMPKLKCIITRSTGFDHIDMKECNKRKIKVMNVPDYSENTVAEHTFALILALSRKIPQSYERTIRGNFSLEGLTGIDLKGKTIGIIGFGKIGRNVARIAKGFEMNIVVYDVKKDSKARGINFVSLNELLKISEIITLHCPLNKQTKHLINLKNVKSLKKGCYIINTARGGNIETRALVEGLSEGIIGGVGLDVLEEELLVKEEIQLLSKKFHKEKLENLIENHLLLKFDSVIMTPHNAFNSKEALKRVIDITLINLDSFIKNKECKNIIK